MRQTSSFLTHFTPIGGKDADFGDFASYKITVRPNSTAYPALANGSPGILYPAKFTSISRISDPRLFSNSSDQRKIRINRDSRQSVYLVNRRWWATKRD